MNTKEIKKEENILGGTDTPEKTRELTDADTGSEISDRSDQKVDDVLSSEQDKPKFKKNVFEKKRRPRPDRPKSEFQQKIINISRVTRVVKGGRRLSFRVDMILGDKKGRVGIGSGKSLDTAVAIERAIHAAQKNMIKLSLGKGNTIPHLLNAKFDAARVEMWPNGGRGIVAGSTVRNVLELAGVSDVTAKVFSRSENKLNNAKAALRALSILAVDYDPSVKMDSEKNDKDEKSSENKKQEK